MSNDTQTTGVRVEAILREKLAPQHLEVVNESHLHSKGSDTHFKVIIVSPAFDGVSAVRRHQLVYGAVGDLAEKGIHALAITSRTPAEWATSPEANVSPRCASTPAKK